MCGGGFALPFGRRFESGYALVSAFRGHLTEGDN